MRQNASTCVSSNRNVVPSSVHQEAALSGEGEQRLALVGCNRVGGGVWLRAVGVRIHTDLRDVPLRMNRDESFTSVSFIALRPFTLDQIAEMK